MRKILVRAGLALLLLLILWMPVIWEQTHRTPGNISRIIDFFATRAGEHTFLEAFYAFASMMLPPFEMRTTFSFVDFIPIALMVLTIFILLNSIRKNSRFSAALCILTVAAEPVMIFSVKRIVGGIIPYLVHWISMVALVNWIPIGNFVWQKLNRIATSSAFRKVAYCAILLGLVVNNSWTMYETDLIRHEDVRIQPLFQDLTTYLDSNEIHKPLLLIADRNEWGIGAGIILQLYKTRRTFSIQGWPTLFGDQFEPAGNEDAYLWLFHGVDLHRVLKKQIINHLIARERNFFIYEVPFSRLENSGLDKPADHSKQRKNQIK